MPYTPPSHRSPSSSVASSPDSSRRPSFNGVLAGHISSPVSPSLPRSSSYLARHRRTSSAGSVSSVASSTSQLTLRPASEGLQSKAAVVGNANHHASAGEENSSSIRQSPPPITGDRRVMPAGAIISPPDSPPSSDDEEQISRGRRLENSTEIQELHEAISQLPKPRRASSPSDPADPTTALAVPALEPLQTTGLDGMRHSFSSSELDHFTRVSNMVARSSSSSSNSRGSSHSRRTHVRSATEPSISITPSGSSSQLNSDEDEDNDLAIFNKPPMVRKKSGELVRPALRFGAGRRPSSMPGTPTFSKVVHFDSHLEHVRHFLQVDRPLAVSAGSSPVETYDSETEYPFTSSASPAPRSPPYEWEIILTKFPVDTPARKAQPVRLERVWLSPDHKFLHGSIAVLNLAFSKLVVCRFTLDYWKTTSEIAAEYSSEITPRTSPEGHDRFNFTIKLSDLANLESKTMYFCIRYNVAGQEFWDNNNGGNFQLDFRKKMLPVNGKGGLQASALPRSHQRRANPSTAPRPRSMPVSMDDFEDTAKVMFDQSVKDFLKESEPPALRLKSSQSSITLPSDNLTGRLSSPSGQAFANRYDFGASLSAAMQATKDTTPKSTNRGGVYMKPTRRGTPSPTSPSTNPAKSTQPSTTVDASKQPEKSTPAASRVLVADSGVHGPGSIASKSYEEIVSKYCFYVPKSMAASKDASATSHGHSKSSSTVGEVVNQPNQPSPASSTASDSSPNEMGRFYQPDQATHQQLPAVNTRWFDVPSRDSSVSSFQSFASDASATMLPSPFTRMVSGQPGIDSTATSSPASPGSPATVVGGFSSYSSTPSAEYDYMKDRFPFNGTDGHSTPAIKG